MDGQSQSVAELRLNDSTVLDNITFNLNLPVYMQRVGVDLIYVFNGSRGVLYNTSTPVPIYPVNNTQTVANFTANSTIPITPQKNSNINVLKISS